MKKIVLALITCYLSILKSTSAKYENLRSPFEGENLILTENQRKNLNRVLELVRTSPDFHPLTLSVIYAIQNTDVLSLISRFVAENSDGGFQVKATEFPTGSQWMNQVGLTWIFLVDDWHIVNAFVHWQSEFWKSRNQYLLIFLDKDHPRPAWKPILKILWKKYNVYKILITSILDDFEWLVRYLPFDFSNGQYGSAQRVFPMNYLPEDKVKNVKYRTLEKKLSHSNNTTDKPKSSNITFNYRKSSRLFTTFDNLRGYPMRVIVFESLMMRITTDERKNIAMFSRLDADVMKELEKYLRSTFKVKVLQRTSGSDPFQEALIAIRDVETEIVITSYFMKQYEFNNNYEFTKSIYEDKLCFIAPNAGPVPKSYMPVVPFGLSFWIALIAYNLIITILWYILSHCSRFIQHNEPIVKPLSKDQYILMELKWRKEKRARHVRKMKMIAKVLRGRINSTEGNGENNNECWMNDEPLEIHPRVLACCDLIILSCYPLQGIAESTSQRIFLLTTLFFGLIIGGLYQSYLVSTLSEPLQYPQMVTLEDVANSNMSIITKYANLKDTFQDDSLLEKTLRDRIKVVKNEEPTLDLVAFDQNVIAMGRLDTLQLENLTRYYDTDGQKLLHIVEECTATYMLAYVVALDSPFLERVDGLILTMQQIGLRKLWYENMIRPVHAEEQRMRHTYADRKVKLTLDHYSLTFLGLFLGLFGCTCVFEPRVYSSLFIKMFVKYKQVSYSPFNKIIGNNFNTQDKQNSFCQCFDFSLL
ncbi:uncharacterized protein [Prorops nasuta]|uniref:uncharacterized protein n=1 Tax=Prorops nasuta TaxID=863751 RepID=UPI0034CE2D96